MPFVEILCPPANPAARTAASRAVTDAIVAGFGVGPETVSVYVLPVADQDYMHAGQSSGTPRRVFVKVHAFRREAAARRAVVEAAAMPMSEAFGVAPGDVAIYFLERSPDEVAHGDRLAGD